MNFKLLVIIIMGLPWMSLQAQDASGEFPVYSYFSINSIFHPMRDFQTFSIEYGRRFGEHFQIFAGGEFYLIKYNSYQQISSNVAEFLGGYVGTGFWLKPLSQKGWNYFVSAKVRRLKLTYEYTPFYSVSDRITYEPEIGNGFTWMSARRFFVQFETAFGIWIPKNEPNSNQIGGDVNASATISIGIRL